MQGAKTVLVAALAMAAGAGGAVLAMNSGAGSAAGVAATDRKAIEAIVREYILTHPEILPEAMRNLERREAAKAVAQQRAPLETPFAGAWEGAADADVTLVEFFDYACGYCKAARADVERLLAEDPKLKIVYRELPILGPESVKATEISLAVAKKAGGYGVFHKTMFATGRPSDAVLDRALIAAGLDPVAIRKEARSPDIQQEIGRNMQMQRALQLSGTPGWVVGTQVINGAVGYDELKAAIAEARKGG